MSSRRGPLASRWTCGCRERGGEAVSALAIRWNRGALPVEVPRAQTGAVVEGGPGGMRTVSGRPRLCPCPHACRNAFSHASCPAHRSRRPSGRRPQRSSRDRAPHRGPRDHRRRSHRLSLPLRPCGGWPQGDLHPLLLLVFPGVGSWDDLHEPSARVRLLLESGLVLVTILVAGPRSMISVSCTETPRSISVPRRFPSRFSPSSASSTPSIFSRVSTGWPRASGLWFGSDSSSSPSRGGLWPFADLALVVTLRRRLRGGPLRADRTHLHRLLLDRGLRPRLMVPLPVALTGVYATLGVAG